MRPLTLTAALIAATLSICAVAGAVRAPTPKEHRQIAKAMKIPPRCTRVQVSTVVISPKWASLSWKPGPKCKPFAADGVAVLKKAARKGATWKLVTAGSSYDCPSLYQQVPQPIAQDLGLDCFTP